MIRQSLSIGLASFFFSTSLFAQEPQQNNNSTYRQKVVQIKSQDNDKSKVSILYFGRFDGYKINPAQEVGEYLKEQGYRAHLMNVEYEDSLNVLKRVYEDEHPEIIIGIGVSHLVDQLGVPLIGRNRIESGNRNSVIDFKQLQVILMSQEDHFFLHNRFSESKIKYQCELSHSLYVCNSITFKGFCLAKEGPLQFYFFHIPPDGYSNKEKLTNIEEAVKALTKD